jgi:hypothetical protein
MRNGCYQVEVSDCFPERVKLSITTSDYYGNSGLMNGAPEQHISVFTCVMINDFVFATCGNLLFFLVIRTYLLWSLVSRSLVLD